MSHPFGDLVSQYLHRKHGLSQSKLAAGILQAPAIVTDMCKGRRLIGAQARERVIAIIDWLQKEGVLLQPDEANALLNAAGMSPLQHSIAAEAMLVARLASTPKPTFIHSGPSGRHPIRANTPLVTASGTNNAPRHLLPIHLTPLIGRSQEVAFLCQRLLQEDCRLLTAVGPPGVGKTRLAVQVATELIDHFADGAFFVPLATLGEAALAPRMICQALGLQESNLPAVDHLKLYLGNKHALLVLDNLEQLLAIAPTLVELLSACPRLHLLVTSRSPLRVRAERQFPVPPLELPDLAHLPDSAGLKQYAAIALFVERSQAVQPAFSLTPENAAAVATICARLDGLPLAIELVAARMKLLSPPALLARLDGALLLGSDGLRDSAPRQQTLRDAIRWSYDLLTPTEQCSFARLGIFSGGFTLEAAEAIVDDLLPEPGAVLTVIASLVDKCLLYPVTDHDEPRFGMLETIHEYALEQLVASGTLPAVQHRHAEIYLQLAETAEPHLRTREQITWLKYLDADRANLRAALSWCVSKQGDPVLGLRLANALGNYWYLRALCGEGSRWLDTVLARAGEDAPAALRAWALYNNCLQANGLDDIERGFALGEAAQKLAYALNDQRLLAYLARPLGQLIQCRDGRAQFQVAVNEGIRLARLLDEPWLTTAFFICLAGFDCDPAQQMPLRMEALAQTRAIGDRTLINCALGLLGATAIRHGDYGQAAAFYEEALQLARALEDKRDMMVILRCGNLACVQGQEEQAAAYFREGLLLAQQTGTPGLIASAHQGFGRLAQRQGKPLETLRHYQGGLRIVQPLGHRLFVAPCLILMAVLADLPAAPIDAVQATRLVGAATAILSLEQMWLEPTDLPAIERTVTCVRARLADPIFGAAWAEGQAMTLDDAVVYALAL